MVNLEAMSMRKPVISTAIDGQAEVLEHDSNGHLLAPGDPGTLAEAMEQLMADEEMRPRISCAAYKTGTRRFRLDDAVRQIERINDAPQFLDEVA